MSLTLLTSAISTPVKAQDYDTQRGQILAYNIFLNGVVGAVGGLIHKAPNEKGWKVFVKNFGKGALGGLVTYSAKYQTYYLRDSDNTFYAPANRLLFFLGNSMVLNASLNQKLLSRYHFNMYGIDMSMNFTEKDKKFLTARISLATLAGMGYFLVQGHKLNIYKSLEYGMYYFDMNPNEKNYSGFATFNCIAIARNPAGQIYYSSIPHEFVHTYQFYDYHSIANLYTPAMKVKYEKYKLYRWMARHFVLDYEVLYMQIPYFLQPTPKYYRNFYEFEAQHFSGRRYIKRPID